MLSPVLHWLRIVPESFKSQTLLATFKQGRRDVWVFEGTVSTLFLAAAGKLRESQGGMELGSRACATVLNFIPTDNTLFHFLQVPIEQQKLTAKIPYKFRQIEILTKIC